VEPKRLLEKSHRLQWSVDELDFDCPGAERVTDQQLGELAPFMADLYWIERVAAVVFEAMRSREDDPTRRAIFASFAEDEARHAEAERRLMIRWGMLGRRQRPQPNPSVAKLLDVLERDAHRVHPSVFAAIIPMTELVLDGALVKFLTRVVDDPLCDQVFEHVNADEARHIAMDFYMLEHYGRSHSALSNTMDLLRSVMRPEGLYALFFGYFPTLTRSRASLERLGIDIEDVTAAMRRYTDLGRRNPEIAKHPTYRLMAGYIDLLTGRDRIGSALVRISDVVDGFRGGSVAA
jgi:hypothetical protein